MRGEGNSQDGEEVCSQNDGYAAGLELLFQVVGGRSDKSPSA